VRFAGFVVVSMAVTPVKGVEARRRAFEERILRRLAHSLPYAGMIRIRFLGVISGPSGERSRAGHPKRTVRECRTAWVAPQCWEWVASHIRATACVGGAGFYNPAR